MQNLIKISLKFVSISAIAFVAVLLFGTHGVKTAEAATQSSYFVDITGNGCGNNCADFYKYLATQGISVSNTSNNTSNSTSNNNGSTARSTSTASTPNSNPNTARPSSNYVQYPYQIYTPFTAADLNRPASSTNTNGYNSATGTINYVQYPYYMYSYFQDPTSKYDSYLSGQYPESTYIYYGKDATEQLNKYKKSSTSTSTANKSSNSGFTITSIIK